MPLADLERLRRPPREVPASLAARLRFGGTFGFIGWLFLAIGLGLVIFLGVLSHARVHLALAVGQTAVTEGTVVGWSETSTSINEAPVVATHFEFAVDGVTYEGEAFEVDQSPAPGTRVRVVYAVGDPRVAKIEGMMIGQLPLWVLAAMLIFPLVGLGLTLGQYRRGRREIRVLRHGIATRGRAIEHRRTGVRVNEVPEYAITFEFLDQLERRHTVVQKTLRPDALLDEDEEPLLFLPDRPDEAVLLDSLPGTIAVAPDGGWAPLSAGSTIGVLIAPLMALCAGLLAALMLL